ncbi:MAG: zinc-ribbon domain-containing protein [Candidatus Hadarchaeum sp.]|uniref:zinc ribbon domain-containing protein n=1 Tax=Candidatus Hadarchaeum sp. TaxID=2883567 RepID=UPI003D0F8253
MVHCTYCGAENEDGVKRCRSCGRGLCPSKAAEGSVSRGNRLFLAQIGSVTGITVGLLIMLFGAGLVLSHLYGAAVEIWPAAFIVFGIMIVSAAISSLRRSGG